MVLCAIYPVGCAAAVNHFMRHRRRSVMLRKRPLSLIVVSCVGGGLCVLSVALRDAVGPPLFPEGVLYALDMVSVPLLAGPLVIRLARFKSEVSFMKAARLRVGKSGSDTESPGRPSTGRKGRGRGAGFASELHAEQVESSMFVSFASYVVYGVLSVLKLKRSEELKAHSGRFISSPYYIAFWVIALSAPYLAAILGFGISLGGYGCVGAELSLEADVFFCVMTILLLVAGVGQVVRMWQRTHDPLGLAPEFFTAWAVGVPLLFAGKLLHIVDPGGLQMVRREVDWLWFTVAAAIWIVCAQTLLPVWWSLRAIVEAALLSSSTFDKEERLRDILMDVRLVEALRDHMVNELSVENLEFIEDVDRFRQTYDSDRDHRQKMARDIYDNYLAKHAFFPINVSSANTQKAFYDFSRGNVAATVFDDARAEIVDLMISDILPRFVRSDFMVKYNARQSRKTRTAGGGKRSSDLALASPRSPTTPGRGPEKRNSKDLAVALSTGSSSPQPKTSKQLDLFLGEPGSADVAANSSGTPGNSTKRSSTVEPSDG